MSLFPPRSTRGLTGAAEAFCQLYCRQPDDDACPFGGARAQCPLWLFVEADLPTNFVSELVEDGRRHHPACPTRSHGTDADSPPPERIAEGEFDPDEGYDWPAP